MYIDSHSFYTKGHNLPKRDEFGYYLDHRR
jgi:hypothetical protein